MKRLNTISWLSAVAVLLAAEPLWAQAAPPAVPVAPAKPKAPAQRPAETPPGEKGALPTSMDALQKEVDTPYRPKPMGHRIKFNLQDADLGELVNHISGMTGKRFIYDAKLRQIKATVISPTPVTLAEAYEAFLSILDANGMTVVPHGPFLKIVDSAGAVTRTTPVYSRGAPVPDSDRMVTRLYRLKSVGADETAALLNKFKSKDGDISTYAPGQLLIITDSGTNVRRMIRIVEELDVGGAGSHMWIEPVYNGTAADMAKRVNELFDLGKPLAPGQQNPSGLNKVVADEQTNSLIVMGTEDSYLKLLELMKKIDAKPTTSGAAHVLPLQNAVAEELANVLTQMLTGAKGKGATGDLFEGEIKITADKATNSLVVTASGRDFASLRLVIDQLDMPRRQVFIEAVIMDVSVDHKNSFGLSYHAGGLTQIATDRDSLYYGGFDPMKTILLPGAQDLQGLALGVRGPEIEGSNQLIGVSVPAFGVVLNALASSGDANVLATPHVLATDNVAAEISVGENIPLQENAGGTLGGLTGATGATGAAGATNNMAALGGLGLYGGLGFSPPRQDVGTKVKVTPHINESNQVRLEIDEEISERGATSGVLGVVSVTKRQAKTTVVVADQQTVVLGGLMRDAVVTSKSAIPVLGDLPVLGFLFRKTTNQTRKTNLLLILTPYVVRSQADLRRVFERKMQERQEFLDRYFVFANEHWTPPRDYTYTNGLIEDIRHAYREFEERQRLEEESAEIRLAPHEPAESIALPVSAQPGASRPRAAPATAPPAAAPPGAAPAPGAAPPGAAPAAPPATPARPTPAPRLPRRPRAGLEAPLNLQQMARNVNLEKTE